MPSSATMRWAATMSLPIRRSCGASSMKATIISHRREVKMPAPERTTHEAIVAAGCELVEQHGLGGLTMRAIAERVGVRAPSLYKRVRNRGELIDLVVEATVEDLTL